MLNRDSFGGFSTIRYRGGFNRRYRGDVTALCRGELGRDSFVGYSNIRSRGGFTLR